MAPDLTSNLLPRPFEDTAQKGLKLDRLARQTQSENPSRLKSGADPLVRGRPPGRPTFLWVL